MKSVVITFIFSAVLSSCTMGDRTVPISQLDNSVIDSAHSLIPENIDFEYPITAKKIYVWNDSIVVVNNQATESNLFIELYSLQDNSMINSMIHKGNGPSEMLEINFYYQNDTIVAEDIHRKNIAVIPIDRAVNHKYIPELKQIDIHSQYILPFKGKLIGVNPNCFISKKYDIYNNGDRFILSDSNYVYKEDNEYTHSTFNVTYSQIILSYINDAVVYISSNEALIELYDTKLRLLKKITGPPMPHETLYYVTGNGAVSFLNGVPYTFMEFCHDNHNFYLAYNGDFLTSENNYDASTFNTYILKFDWDGNFIDSYYIDHYVKSMSLSNDGRYIYAFGTDHDGESVFYKYLLK